MPSLDLIRFRAESRYSDGQPRDEKGKFGSGAMLSPEAAHHEALHLAAAKAHTEISAKEASAGHPGASQAHKAAADRHGTAANAAITGSHQDYKNAAAVAEKASNNALKVTTNAYVAGEKP